MSGPPDIVLRRLCDDDQYAAETLGHLAFGAGRPSARQLYRAGALTRPAPALLDFL